MNRFLLFCHNKRPSYDLDFIIEEPLIFTYLQKNFHTAEEQTSVANLNTFAHISLLAVAVAVITTRSGQSYRKIKTVKRIA